MNKLKLVRYNYRRSIKVFIENDNINLQFYEGSVVGLELPDNITLKVEETEAVVKGQTAASSYKPAILTGGIKTICPTIYIYR